MHVQDIGAKNKKLKPLQVRKSASFCFFIELKSLTCSASPEVQRNDSYFVIFSHWQQSQSLPHCHKYRVIAGFFSCTRWVDFTLELKTGWKYSETHQCRWFQKFFFFFHNVFSRWNGPFDLHLGDPKLMQWQNGMADLCSESNLAYIQLYIHICNMSKICNFAWLLEVISCKYLTDQPQQSRSPKTCFRSPDAQSQPCLWPWILQYPWAFAAAAKTVSSEDTNRS